MNETTPSLHEKHSLPIRLWHWGSALVVTASLTTILIQSTLLNRQVTTASVQDVLQKEGATVSTDVVRELSRSSSEQLWQWHKYFGYVLVGLFVFRILLEFFQSKDERFIGRIKNALAYLKLPTVDRATARHYLIVKLIYAFFYLSLSVTVLTGLTMVFGGDVGIDKPVRALAREIHNINMYVILAYIFVHLSGVILGELGKYAGVVSEMINGGGKIR